MADYSDENANYLRVVPGSFRGLGDRVRCGDGSEGVIRSIFTQGDVFVATIERTDGVHINRRMDDLTVIESAPRPTSRGWTVVKLP